MGFGMIKLSVLDFLHVSLDEVIFQFRVFLAFVLWPSGWKIICGQTCAPGAITIGTNAFTERMGLEPSQAGFPGKLSAMTRSMPAKPLVCFLVCT